MKNVVESLWPDHTTIFQAKLGMNVWKELVCHYPEGGVGRARVENSQVGQVVYWPGLILILFF